MRQVEELFDAVVDLPPSERDAYLDANCSDTSLRAEVTELLRCDDSAGALPAGARVVAPDEEGERRSDLPESIDGYRVLDLLGEGGMGTVYLARQEEPVERRVALKVIKLGMDTKRVVGRFEAERQALALMDHPNIARVIDGGVTEDGRPYFVMECVPGVSITEFCDRRRLTIRERLELFLEVCDAIQHAHQKGIIHRDVKPSNVLVSGQGVPKVIDFGVAKAISRRLSSETVYTEDGQLVGTPEYMSPEQAELTRLDVDTRTDVYSLGVLLYELLTGAPPFPPTQLQAVGLDEIRRRIREEEPETPSTRLSVLEQARSTDIAGQRRSTRAAMVRQFRGDLDWITMKAMEKDRSRRYASASELAADIERFLADEPVLAKPPTTIYRLRKFVSRNRVAVGAGGAVALAIVVGIALAILGLMRAHEEWQRAESAAELAKTEAATANTVVDLLLEMFESANPHESKPLDYTVRALLDDYSDGLEVKLVGQPEVERRLRSAIGAAYEGLGELERAEAHLKAAVERAREVHGDVSPEVAEALSAYGWLQHLRGEYEKPETLYREALAILRELHGPDTPLAVETLTEIGDLQWHRMEYEIARGTFNEALELLESSPVESESHYYFILRYLARIESATANNDEAEAIYRRILDGRRRYPEYLGGTPIADAAIDLALFLYNIERSEECVPFAREALDIRLARFGDDDHRVAACRGLLAEVQREQGDPQGAEPVLRRTMEILERSLGRRHHEPLQHMLWLARALIDLGRVELGEQYLADARSRIDVFEENSALRLAIDEQRGKIALRRRDFAKAEPLFRGSLALREKRFGVGHRNCAATLNNLASACILRRDHNAAEHLLLQALAAQLDRVTSADTARFRDDPADFFRSDGDERSDTVIAASRAGGDHTKPGISSMLKNLGAVSHARRDFEAAEKYCRESLAMRRALYGDDHLEVARVLELLAMIVRDRGSARDAMPIYQRALDSVGKSVGEEHPQAAEILQGMGAASARFGAVDDAEKYLRRALDIHRKNGMSGNEAGGNCLNELGLLMRRLQNHGAAQSLFQEALEVARGVFGERHPMVAAVLNNLGTTKLSRGDAAGARTDLEASLDQRREFDGDESPTVAVTLMNLADVLNREKDYDAAREVLRESVATYAKLYANGHPRRAYALSKLGRVLYSLGEHEDAAKILDEALAMRRRVFGAETLSVASDLSYLGMTQKALGLLEEAEQTLRESTAVWRKRQGDVHANVAASLMSLGGVVFQREKYADALGCYLEARDIRARVHGEGSLTLAEPAYYAGVCLQRLERHEEAERSFRASLAIRRAKNAMKHRHAPRLLEVLATYAEKRGEPGDAEPLYREALAIHREAQDENDPTSVAVALAACRLARAIGRGERYEEAEPMFLEGYRALEKLEKGRAHLSEVAGWIAALYESWGKPEEAAEWNAKRSELEAD